MTVQAGKKKTTFQDQGWKMEGNFLKEVGQMLMSGSNTKPIKISSLKKGKFEANMGDRRQLSKVAGKFEANAEGQKATFQK